MPRIKPDFVFSLPYPQIIRMPIKPTETLKDTGFHHRRHHIKGKHNPLIILGFLRPMEFQNLNLKNSIIITNAKSRLATGLRLQ